LGVPCPILEESLPKSLRRLRHRTLKHLFSSNRNLFQGPH